jgi:hypothetical protein
MVSLLEQRKAGLGEMLRERFRAAREAGTVADVKALSGELRKVKAALEAARGGR